MNGRPGIPTRHESGAVLVIALIFLVTITMLTVASMRSSNIGLYMAQNEESRIAAAQGAQALADAIVSDPSSTPVIGGSGYTICTAGESNCDSVNLTVDNELLAAAIASGDLSARVERLGPAFRPPPRMIESSIDKFASATFQVSGTYDRTDEGLGRRQIAEGVMVLVPAF